MGLALHGYHDANGYLPAGYNTAAVTGWGTTETAQRTVWEGTGWTSAILPYMEQTAIYNQLTAYVTANPGMGNNGPPQDTGLSLPASPVYGFIYPMYICPTNTRPLVGWDGVAELISYLGNAGTVSGAPAPTQDGVLYAVNPPGGGAAGKGPTLVGISDGTSNTIAIGERPCTGDVSWGWGFGCWGVSCESAVNQSSIQFAWGDGDVILGSNDVQMILGSGCGDPTSNVGFKAPINPMTQGENDIAHFWSFHPNGANFLFADGHVQMMSYSTATATFAALCTRSGGEAVILP